MRRLWKTYLSELHGVVFVLDAANPTRFAEAKKALEDSVAQDHLKGKAILVLANKQDLPTAVPSHEAAVALGLSQPEGESSPTIATTSGCSFNILACTALTPAGSPHDVRMTEGLRWLMGEISKNYPQLNQRVQRESELVRAEELRKKKEREEAVRKMKEERQRKQEEEEAAAKLAAAKGPSEALEPPLAQQMVAPRKDEHEAQPDLKPSTKLESRLGVVNASYDGTPLASKVAAIAPIPTPQPPPIGMDSKAVFSDLSADKEQSGSNIEVASEASEPSTSTLEASGTHGQPHGQPLVTRPGSAAGKKPPLSSPHTSVLSTGLSSSGVGGVKVSGSGASNTIEVRRTSSASRSSNKIVPVSE